jgi:hypothetical protein
MKLEALKELAAKVEAGECQNDGSMFRAFGDRWTICLDAYNGSLDAAKALHEAVLPGWTASVGQNIHHKFWRTIVTLIVEGAGIDHSANHDNNPARAWLLAILKALIAQGEEK